MTMELGHGKLLYWAVLFPISVCGTVFNAVLIWTWSEQKYKFNRFIIMTLAVSNTLYMDSAHLEYHLTGAWNTAGKLLGVYFRQHALLLCILLAFLQHVYTSGLASFKMQPKIVSRSRVITWMLLVAGWCAIDTFLKTIWTKRLRLDESQQKIISLCLHILTVFAPQAVQMYFVVKLAGRMRYHRQLMAMSRRMSKVFLADTVQSPRTTDEASFLSSLLWTNSPSLLSLVRRGESKLTSASSRNKKGVDKDTTRSKSVDKDTARSKSVEKDTARGKSVEKDTTRSKSVEKDTARSKSVERDTTMSKSKSKSKTSKSTKSKVSTGEEAWTISSRTICYQTYRRLIHNLKLELGVERIIAVICTLYFFIDGIGVTIDELIFDIGDQRSRSSAFHSIVDVVGFLNASVLLLLLASLLPSFPQSFRRRMLCRRKKAVMPRSLCTDTDTDSHSGESYYSVITASPGSSCTSAFTTNASLTHTLTATITSECKKRNRHLGNLETDSHTLSKASTSTNV